MPVRLTLLLALAVTACDTAADVPGTTADGPDLGDPYRVESRPMPAVVSGGVLEVNVSYAGGCEEHTFDLGVADRGDRADLWLTHDANGDACEAYVQDFLAVPVPEAVLGKTLRLYVSETETAEVPVIEAGD